MLSEMPANRPFLLIDFPAGAKKVFVYKRGLPKKKKAKGKKSRRKKKQNQRRLYEIVGRVRARGRYKTKLFRGKPTPHAAVLAVLIPAAFAG